MLSNVVGFLVAGFVASACLVPAARWLSVSTGLVARPKADRWSLRPVGKLGGIAMALALGLVLAGGGLVPALWPLVVTSAGIVALGFLDDVIPIGPATKLVGQMLVTALLIYLMPPFSITGYSNLDPMLGFLWVLGLTNAFNLLDNIDGLAAGIAAITAAFLTATLLLDGAPGLVPLGLALAAFVGVTIGFLVYNFHPASIFMGDSGSHLLGFVISGGALLAVPHLNPTTLVPVVVRPIIILLIPIFDTTFVTITRGLAGRSIFTGGRDHTSHRLVALGIGERRAVLVLYALAVLGGLLGLGFQGEEARYSWGLTAMYGGLLVGMGIYLGHVDAARQDVERPTHPLLPSELTNRYRILEVGIDALLICIAYFLAFGIRFREPEFTHFLPHFARSLPLVLTLQLAGLTLAGKYRLVWRSFGSTEVWTLLRGIALGVGLTVVVVLYLYNFQGFSRLVFVFETALLPVFIIGARAAFSAADDYLRRKRSMGRMAIVIGAGHGGALAVRELLQNLELGCVPLGLLDDDEVRQKTRVDGYRVLGPISHLGQLLETHQSSVAVVIVAIRNLTDDQFAGICEVCDAHGVDVRRLRFSIEDVDWRDRTPGIVKFQKR